MKKLKPKLPTLMFFISSFLLLTIAIKGKGSLNYYQMTKNTEVGSPFESSGSTSRYALTEAIVENQTFFLTEEQARFAAPDVVSYQNKFFSIFTPGVALFGIPFYLVGKIVGLPQLATYLSTALLALLNLFLVVKLSRKLGAGLYSSLLTGFIFLFATNAFSYALTFTQHHASTALIFLSLINAFEKRTWLKNIDLGILLGMGLLVDLPNILMMLPILIYAIFKHLTIKKTVKKIKLSFKLTLMGIIIGLIPFLIFFGWYNYQLTGSYTKIGQMIGRSDFFEIQDTEEIAFEEREAVPFFQKLPFKTRNQLNGFYVLLTSNERGWLYYSPIVALGLLGLFLAYQKKTKSNLVLVATAVVLVNIVIYSMLSDPYGGWAFGPRYLIPGAAILCSALGIAIHAYKNNVKFFLIFLLLAMYSLEVNVVGAMTTTQIPPQVEAVNLIQPIPYTYQYNWQLLEKNLTSSLAYNLYLSKRMSLTSFLSSYYLLGAGTILLIYLVAASKKTIIKKLK